MKKGFLIVSLMFLALYATAQDIYTDMLAEGKTWQVQPVEQKTGAID